jgi:hypothetical protein
VNNLDLAFSCKFFQSFGTGRLSLRNGNAKVPAQPYRPGLTLMKTIFGKINATTALGDKGIPDAELAAGRIQLAPRSLGDPHARNPRVLESGREILKPQKKLASGPEEGINGTENHQRGPAQAKTPG